MKATTCFAALATIGLLALTACVHDGGNGGSPSSGRPATTETDMSAATLNGSRGANSAEILDVTAQAAMSLPQFGSVVQSAAVDVASASGVSTSFDGTDLTITVSREDGSALTLDTGGDASDASGAFDSPIAGHSARAWGRVEDRQRRYIGRSRHDDCEQQRCSLPDVGLLDAHRWGCDRT